MKPAHTHKLFLYYKEHNIWPSGKGSFLKSKVLIRHVVRVSLCFGLPIAFKILNELTDCYKIRCEHCGELWGQHETLCFSRKHLVMTNRRACELLRCEQCLTEHMLCPVTFWKHVTIHYYK